jgi:hypothetical protein
MCYTPVPILQSLHKMLHLVPSSHTQLKEHEHSLLRIDPHAVVLMHTPHLQTEPIQHQQTLPTLVVEAYINHTLGCPSPNITRFAVVFLSERLFLAFLPVLSNENCLDCI